MTIAPHKHAGRPLSSLGFIGHGYVGRATACALGQVAQVAYHDPAMPDSVPLKQLVEASDALFICLPTPQGIDGSADLRLVIDVLESVVDRVGDRPIVLKSTVPPGTCSMFTHRWPTLQLVFAPEFLRERHHLEDAAAPARVVLGWTDAVKDATKTRLGALFARRFPHVPVVAMTAGEAELLKYTSNALFGVKVSFANEMSELAESMGISWEPIRRALILDPRIGDGHLAVPGPDGLSGFGGTCLPKDIAGLLSVARCAGVELDVVEAATRGNRRRRSRPITSIATGSSVFPQSSLHPAPVPSR